MNHDSGLGMSLEGSVRRGQLTVEIQVRSGYLLVPHLLMRSCFLLFIAAEGGILSRTVIHIGPQGPRQGRS